MEKLIELLGTNAHYGFVLVDEFFANHLDGNTNGSSASSFTSTSLEQIEVTLLNGELEVLHVSIVFLEFFVDCYELVIERGHGLFHCWKGARPSRSSERW